jgi:hypothetical protein
MRLLMLRRKERIVERVIIADVDDVLVDPGPLMGVDRDRLDEPDEFRVALFGRRVFALRQFLLVYSWIVNIFHAHFSS